MSFNRLKVLKRIGSGAFGKVFLCEFQGTLFVIKRQRKYCGVFGRESKALQKVEGCSTIIECVGSFLSFSHDSKHILLSKYLKGTILGKKEGLFVDKSSSDEKEKMPKQSFINHIFKPYPLSLSTLIKKLFQVSDRTSLLGSTDQTQLLVSEECTQGFFARHKENSKPKDVSILNVILDCEEYISLSSTIPSPTISKFPSFEKCFPNPPQPLGFSSPALLSLFYSLLMSISKLSEVFLVHRDIKSGNVMVNPYWRDSSTAIPDPSEGSPCVSSITSAPPPSSFVLTDLGCIKEVLPPDLKEEEESSEMEEDKETIIPLESLDGKGCSEEGGLIPKSPRLPCVPGSGPNNDFQDGKRDINEPTKKIYVDQKGKEEEEGEREPTGRAKEENIDVKSASSPTLDPVDQEKDHPQISSSSEQSESNNPFCSLQGSPLYRSPEYFISQPPSHRGDVWSVCALMCECISGCTPWMWGKDDSLDRRWKKKEGEKPASVVSSGVESGSKKQKDSECHNEKDNLSEKNIGSLPKCEEDTKSEEEAEGGGDNSLDFEVYRPDSRLWKKSYRWKQMKASSFAVGKIHPYCPGTKTSENVTTHGTPISPHTSSLLSLIRVLGPWKSGVWMTEIGEWSHHISLDIPPIVYILAFQAYKRRFYGCIQDARMLDEIIVIVMKGLEWNPDKRPSAKELLADILLVKSKYHIEWS
ncbi:hypothetical protein ADUPG1_008518 [Aduncisulcus paluster]|uniref:non-specific serine/threonine protein kinase n=1 Tax=Aduncisulcus paluster TaxID=2918883 RepID=A0ABQ5KTI5_9EUKA|nr:hypothetical protein ADUPG1_008518 [Aduncisulcus paluster]